jgi:hypothetical protein
MYSQPRRLGQVSRLDAFIARLLAQRACLARAAELITDIPGPVLELGLGNGRTFDHLRTLFPQRRIFVFERQPAPHPACVPTAEQLVLGDLRATLPDALARIGTPAALVHSDIGTADTSRDAMVAAWLASVLPKLIAHGGVVASDQALHDPALLPLPLPPDVAESRYFLYHCAAKVAVG